MEEIAILLVEDERIVALDLGTSLRRLGYSVIGTASSGEQALRMAGELKPHLILMDIQLGGDLDGIEAAQEIDRSFGIPVVYITAFSDDQTLERARESGQYGFISKNADARSLHSSIQMAVERFSRESKIKESEAELSAAIGSMGDAVLRLNGDGYIVGWDGNATGVFGYSEADAKGQHITFLSTPYSQDEMRLAVQAVAKGAGHPRFEALLEKADGARVLASVKINVLSGSDGRVYGMSMVASDITERRIVEKAVLDISDRERTRIGQDLHDGLGQRLTGIALSLKALEAQVSSADPNLTSELSRIHAQVRQAIDETRMLSKGLMPPSLRSDGLALALESLAAAADPNGPDLIFDNNADAEIADGFIETQLYRIAQEAITNALRHSECSEIQVMMHRNESDLALKIIDNGNGFESHSNGGLGLRIMEYRSDAIGAKLSLNSVKNSGTEVVCEVRIPAWEESR